jgi:hypothetical protein
MEPSGACEASGSTSRGSQWTESGSEHTSENSSGSTLESGDEEGRGEAELRLATAQQKLESGHAISGEDWYVTDRYFPYVPYRSRLGRGQMPPYSKNNGIEVGESGDAGQGFEEDECERIDQLFSAYSEVLFASRSLQAMKETVQSVAAKKAGNGYGPYHYDKEPGDDMEQDHRRDSRQQGWKGYSYDMAEYKQLAMDESLQRLWDAELELQVASA